MERSRKTPKKKFADFPYALRSFLGYLEGTQKAAHTIKNYRLDVLAFQNFLQSGEGTGARPVKIENLNHADVERFHNHLKSQGLKTNTRRRKLLTVQQFLNYLSGRKKAPIESSRKVPTPHKIERIPATVSSARLIEAIRALPAGTLIETRNRALLWTLAETGCLVSEVTHLRFDQWSAASLSFEGKSPRSVAISRDLFEAIQELHLKAGKGDHLFHGFNKFGSMGAPITARGIELLVRFHGPRLGFPELTPRIFRHSAVLRWHEDGADQAEIQRRLGLKTAYAFRAYGPLLKSRSGTTSTGESSRTES